MRESLLKRDYRAFDAVFALLIIFMTVMGLVILGSAVNIKVLGSHSLYSKQRLWILSGLFLMTATAFIDYHFYIRFYIPLYIINIAVLGLVFFLSKVINNTNRWYGVGEQSIQPSEFSKILSILFLAGFFQNKGELLENFWRFLALLALTLLPVALIYLQPALSASVVVFTITLFVIFVSGVRLKFFAILLVFILPVVTFFYNDLMGSRRLTKFVLQEYQIERIDTMLDPTLDPDTYRQLEKSRNAIGSGKLYGRGLYNGIISSGNAESETDMIFSVLGEEFGFLGCAAVIVLMCLIVLKCMLHAKGAPDAAGRAICAGAGVMFFFQSFFHVGVTIGLLPVTGVTFPFFSYGGSSMWASMISAGLVINVGMSKRKGMFEKTE